MVLGAKKRIRLHTKDGRTFEGVLMRRRPVYELDLAELIDLHPETHNTERTPIEGRAIVERDNVSFFQVLS